MRWHLLGIIFILVVTGVSPQLSSELYTRFYDIISAGKTTVFVENVGVPITKIDLNVAGTSYNVRFYFNSYSYNPSNLPLQENVYTYVHIIVMNLDASYLQPSTIEFRVEKAWLQKNNVASMQLFLLKDGQWVGLATKQVGEDSAHYFYHATTTEFGYFSLSGQGVAPIIASVESPVEQKETPPEIATEPEPAVTENTEEVIEIPLEEPPNISSAVYLIVMFAAIMSGGGLALFLYKDQLFGKTKKIGRVKQIEDVPESQILILVDKTEIRNLYELEQTLTSMSDALYSQHTLAGKNDFADWVQKALKMPGLANQLRTCSSRKHAIALVQDECAKLDCALHEEYFITKYHLTQEQYISLYAIIIQWKRDNVPVAEMRNRLQERRLSNQAIDDFLFGPPEDIEDFTIHQEDEGAINVYLFDAMSEHKTPEEIKRDLLEAGWPRAVVEKKLYERFRV